MKTKQLSSLFLLALFAITGCKNNDNVNPTAKLTNGIYVAGSTAAGPTLWQNGTGATVGNLSNSLITGMAVSGNDVYVSGNLTSTSNINTAAYWKNGVITKLTDGTKDASTYGITISGTDVYVWGYVSSGTVPTYDTELAAYWKNGVLTVLSTIGHSTVEQMVVNGTDVYALGNTAQQNLGKVVYWKNGTINQVSDISKSANAGGIAVQNNNVYVAYSEVETNGSDLAYVWQNGAATVLADDLPLVAINSLLVNGTDVYVVGHTSPSPIDKVQVIFWKNGAAQKFAQLPGSKPFDFPSAITLSGTDVLVAGQSQGQAGYWKNGVFVKLGDELSNAVAITEVTN